MSWVCGRLAQGHHGGGCGSSWRLRPGKGELGWWWDEGGSAGLRALHDMAP